MNRIVALQIAARCLEITWCDCTEPGDREKIVQAEFILKDMIRELTGDYEANQEKTA